MSTPGVRAPVIIQWRLLRSGGTTRTPKTARIAGRHRNRDRPSPTAQVCRRTARTSLARKDRATAAPSRPYTSARFARATCPASGTSHPPPVPRDVPRSVRATPWWPASTSSCRAATWASWGQARRFLIGRRWLTRQLAHERLPKTKALAVFASDALSSSSYATEEILRILILGGALAGFTLPVAVAIGLLLASW